MLLTPFIRFIPRTSIYLTKKSYMCTVLTERVFTFIFRMLVGDSMLVCLRAFHISARSCIVYNIHVVCTLFLLHCVRFIYIVIVFALRNHFIAIDMTIISIWSYTEYGLKSSFSTSHLHHICLMHCI